MPEAFNKPWTGFIFDIETGGTERAFDYNAFSPGAVNEFLEVSSNPARYAQSNFFRSTFDKKTGKPFQLLEFFGEQYQHQIPFFNQDLEAGWSGFHHASSAHLQPQPGFQMSKFSRDQGIEQRAIDRAIVDQATGAAVSEEQFAGAFYQRLEQQIAEQGNVELRAWNGLYDINFLEATTHRYESLKDYRGFFANKTKEGVFRYRGLEDEMFQAIFQYGQETPGFAEDFLRLKPTGQVAKSWEELRQLPGWSVENVTNALGGWKSFVQDAQEAHHSLADVGAERRIGQAFEWANELIADGTSAKDALGKVGLLDNGQTVEGFMQKLLSTPWKSQVEREAAEGSRLLANAREVSTAVTEISMARPLMGAGILLGAAVAMGLAVGKRTDRQTQIEGLRHRGEAGKSRRANTDFGSGWQGLDEQSHNDRAFFSMATLGGVYAAHGWALRNVEGWAHKTYKLGSLIENRFPNKIFTTFGASQRASQYLPDNLTLGFHDLFGHLGQDVYGNVISKKTAMGGHLQRLIGEDTSLQQIFLENRDTTLQFLREDASSPFMRMHINGQATANHVSFAKRGALTASSMRYLSDSGKDFFPESLEWVQRPDGTGRQIMRGTGEVEAATARAAGESIFFQPFLAKTDGQALHSISDRLSRETFSLTERMNRLLNEVHIGIDASSYKSSAGLIGQILAKRVLPVAVGLTAIKYADYLTGHVTSNFGWSLFAKAKIAHAEATDSVPGARGLTDWYKDHVPGPQYGPLAMPLAGAAAGGLWHFGKVLSGAYDDAKMADRSRSMWGKPLEFLKDLTKLEFNPGKLGPAGAGMLIGAAAILPLVPGMLGSRKTAKELRAEYSGEEPVEIRSGRWWEIGATPFGGNRILMRRPHSYVLHKSRAEDISLYGSEEEKWAHNPLISPLSWFKDPYYLEKKHVEDRPYPMGSPAFSNVPWVGGMLAASIGKIVKPPKRLQKEKWSGEDYTLFTPMLEPKGPEALAPVRPKEEFGVRQVLRGAARAFSEMIGLPGFVARSAWARLGPPRQPGLSVYYQGSRAMTNVSRRYYEQELGAMMGPSAEGMYGYSEGLRRFLQHDNGLVANELQNQMPSWLPNGNEYFHDFHKGDPYVGIPMGYARLPGTGYEALHPELEGVAAEDYPDIEKLRVLADVAPWSSKFKQMASIVGSQAREDTTLEVEFQKIVKGAERIRESTVNFTDRHTGETDEVEGTVSEISHTGLRLAEMPGTNFRFSAVSTTAADLSSLALGAGNKATADIAADVERRQAGRDEYLANELKPGTKVHMVVPRGGADVSQTRAVVYAGGTNVNLELTNRGFAKPDMEAAGPEVQAMDGPVGRMMRKYAEGMAFSGGESWFNPMRYVPTPAHSKLWQEREPIEQYLLQEVLGTRKRRWQRPFHDMLQPWMHGAAYRLTGRVIVSPEVQKKRDLDTMTDQLAYMRELYGMSSDPAHRGVHSMKAARTAIGSNLSGPSEFLPQTLSNRDRKYFGAFLKESNPDRRSKILSVVSKEMSNALQAQWIKDSERVARAEGQDIPYEETNSPEETTTRDFERSTEIAEFFHRRGLKLPDPDSEIMSENIDYQDVKLKIIQWEGLDAHDFGIYDDRVAMLARKPYLDGAVRELTQGDDRSVEAMTSQVQRAIAASKSGDRNADVRMTRQGARAPRRNVTVTMDTQPDEEMKKEVRRNPDDYR